VQNRFLPRGIAEANPGRTVVAWCCVLFGVVLHLQWANVTGNPTGWALCLGSLVFVWMILHVLLWSFQKSGAAAPCRAQLELARITGWLALVGYVLVGYAYTDVRAQLLVQTRWPSHWHGIDLDVTGTVNSIALTSHAAGQGNGGEMLIDSPGTVRSVRVIFTLEDILFANGQALVDDQQAQALQRLPQRVLLTWSGGLSLAEGGLNAAAPDMLPGQRWRMRVVLQPVHGLFNPGGFDQELWLWGQGIHTRASVRARWQDPMPEMLQEGTTSIDAMRQKTKQALQAQATYGHWPPFDMAGESMWRQRAMGVVAALAVGEQRAISAEDWGIFRETGVAHLVSISGMHITLFAALGIPLLTWMWRQTVRISPMFCTLVSAPVVGLWGGIALSMLYALFSGWGIPAQRTVWMLVLSGVLAHLGLGWPWWVRCLCIATSMTVLNPWSLLQPGFWLSFIAVAMLMGQNDLPPSALTQENSTLMKRLYLGSQRLVAEQMRLAWVLAPLSMLFFSQVSVVGLVANILAVPWVTFLVTPLSLLGAGWPALWDWAALTMYPMLIVLQHMAQWPMASWSSATPPWPVATLAVLAAAWWTRAIGGRKPRHVWVLVLALPALLWRTPSPSLGEFTVTALDVGQGNALVVRTQRHVLLYDTGTVSAAERALLPWLAHQGLRVDRMVVSHSDSDHAGGALAVLDSFPNAQVWASVPENSDIHRNLVAKASSGVWPCSAPQSWHWDGVVFEIMHPKVGVLTPLSPKPNANSCVLRVAREKGGQSASVLLTADIEMAQEALLAEQWQARRLPAVDALLVPHHGSQTSSSEAFLQTTAPHMAWVQAGVNNVYGHPAQRIMQRYRDRGITVFQSSTCGAATWRSDQADAMHCYRQSAGRYWHKPNSAW
jgi:competence protein ComEC